jgi:glycosyltransferase involved in cell wall biosynthesis
MSEVSVILPCYNDEKYIEDCISSILNQSYSSFELFVVNDGSTDKSLELINSIKDKRIIIISNPNNNGAGYARNLALSKAQGEYLFFTDSDCIVDKEWIQNGLKEIKKSNCLGLEGKTYYVSRNHEATLSDNRPGDVDKDEQYMTCNMVYRSEIIKRVGGFSLSYFYHEDRELALRVLKYGKIAHCDIMRVTHREKKWTIRSYIRSAKRVTDRTLLFKYHNERLGLYGRILRPFNLIKIVVPPLAIIKPILTGKVKSWDDLKLVPFVYLKLIYERLLIWKSALKEEIFII